ncbi:hypothetical protein M0R45_035034 [Rubus argutus]|uniref:Uncharacterized protein n=1 Tax=Rubus argutus TaxID=59490 RepID=A0AAW1VVM6_RUBAR
MNCEKRLKAAADIILADDARAGDARVSTEELGVTATLKPHQVEGVSWLIRRYNLGVNVILGHKRKGLVKMQIWIVEACEIDFALKCNWLHHIE